MLAHDHLERRAPRVERSQPRVAGTFPVAHPELRMDVVGQRVLAHSGLEQRLDQVWIACLQQQPEPSHEEVWMQRLRHALRRQSIESAGATFAGGGASRSKTVTAIPFRERASAPIKPPMPAPTTATLRSLMSVLLSAWDILAVATFA